MKLIRYMMMLAIMFPPIVTAQEMPLLGIIDFYGLHDIEEANVRTLLPFSEGDQLPREVASIAEELATALGVEKVEISRVCCTERGEGIVFIGLEEVPMPSPQYHESPVQDTSLPAEVLQASNEMDRLLVAAVMRGEATEDHTQGHSLAAAPEVRSVQERFPGYAERYWQELIAVLRNSGDSEQRAVASMVIAYASDKSAAVSHLQWAALDSDDGVRNNATRALAVIAEYSAKNPSFDITIDPDPIIEMLGSLRWSDRNKGSSLINALTQSHDPGLFDKIRERAIFPLLEMCHWRSHGHGAASCLTLVRVLGLPEQSPPYDADAKGRITAAALPLLPPEFRTAAERFGSDFAGGSHAGDE